MKKQTIKLMIAVASSLMAFSASAAEPCKAYVKMDLGYAKTFNTRVSGAAFVPTKPDSVNLLFSLSIINLYIKIHMV